MKALVALLDTVPVPAYTMVPANTKEPFIYIGQVSLSQQQNKSNFYRQGSVEIMLYTGDNAWTGSLDVPYSYIEQMKLLLQPSITFKPLPQMTYWIMFNDSGLETVDSVNRIYSATLQYEFQIQDDGVDNVVFGLDNVVFGSDNVVKS